MSSRIFERYYASKGVVFDNHGYAVEKTAVRKKSPPSSPIAPEVITEEDYSKERMNKSKKEFIDFETRMYTPASDLVSGKMYMTKGKELFLYVDGNVIFYDKVYPYAELKNQGVEEVLTRQENLWNGTYQIIVGKNEAGIPMVFCIQQLGEEILPVIEYMVKPVNFKKTGLTATSMAKKDGIVLLETDEGAAYVGVQADSYTQERGSAETGDREFSYFGILVPLRPQSPKDVIPISVRRPPIPISKYLLR